MKTIKEMDTPDFFVGARLGGARVKAGISLEKAAKDTRIRVQRLREIEADDFSGFSHPTYSRLFLLDYAEYLGISPDEIRPLLPDRAGAGAGGFEYIDALARDPSSPVSPRPYKRPNLFKIFVIVAAALILAAVGLYVYATVKKIGRVAASSSLGIKPPAGKSLQSALSGDTASEPSAVRNSEESAPPEPAPPAVEPSDAEDQPAPPPSLP